MRGIIVTIGHKLAPKSARPNPLQVATIIATNDNTDKPITPATIVANTRSSRDGGGGVSAAIPPAYRAEPGTIVEGSGLAPA